MAIEMSDEERERWDRFHRARADALDRLILSALLTMQREDDELDALETMWERS